MVDILIHILVDEHSYEKDGEWTLRVSFLRQIKGKLPLDLIAVFPIQQLLKGIVSPKVS